MKLIEPCLFNEKDKKYADKYNIVTMTLEHAWKFR